MSKSQPVYTVFLIRKFPDGKEMGQALATYDFEKDALAHTQVAARISTTSAVKSTEDGLEFYVGDEYRRIFVSKNLYLPEEVL